MQENNNGMKKTAVVLTFVLFLVSCGSKKAEPVYVDTDETQELQETSDPQSAQEEASPAQSGDEVIVPFRNENGTKYVQVKINGVSLEMIFDTGCSTTSISAAEANYLYQKGVLTDEDFLGTEKATIADGSIVDNMVVNLREVVISDKILCPNVTAHVSENTNAPLLLGNEVLDRLATITINNEDNTLLFKLK